MSGLAARQRADDVHHGGTILLAEAHVHELLIEFRRAIEHGGCNPDAVGKLPDHVEIVLQSRHGALRGKEAPLRHPGRPDAELGRTATAGGDGLDHEIDIDAGLQAERHRFRGRGATEGAGMRTGVDPPLPVAMALIMRSTSTPAFRPSAIASAVAAMLMATSRLLTSFTRLAAPNGPKYRHESAKPPTSRSAFVHASLSPAR